MMGRDAAGLRILRQRGWHLDARLPNGRYRLLRPAGLSCVAETMDAAEVERRAAELRSPVPAAPPDLAALEIELALDRDDTWYCRQYIGMYRTAAHTSQEAALAEARMKLNYRRQCALEGWR